ncbi:MAG: class I SAM-dependent methyltransferase [Butyricicoccus pullicaecorum]|nr:class I SAM-dependent methyltransferase [Butyricicoccus pullicaecorum]
MKERIPMTDFAQQWTAQIKQSTSPRMKEDAAEQEFWKQFIRTKVYAPEASSRQVLAFLRPLFADYQIETALEIGSGWGNYTLDLAAICREVACVDISQDVLHFILETGAAHGYHNLTAHPVKWEAFEPDKQYDLVFGYNCFYRQEDLVDCFSRMQRTARKLCVAGMNTGLAPVWVHELEQAGAQIHWEWKDYMYFVGVLYQMGIDPNVRILPFQKTLTYPNTAALVRGECARCGCPDLAPEIAKPILCRHFTQQPDGSWTAQLRFRSGIVWWEPKQI